MSQHRSSGADSASPNPDSQSFTRQQRLLNAEQFNAVFKQNQRSRDHCFIVLARRNHLTYARLGLAVSRKAAGDAVPRNRLKRLIRESFRTHALSGMDCVVMAQSGAARHDGVTLLKSLDRHWSRVSELCKK